MWRSGSARESTPHSDITLIKQQFILSLHKLWNSLSRKLHHDAQRFLLMKALTCTEVTKSICLEDDGQNEPGGAAV